MPIVANEDLLYFGREGAMFRLMQRIGVAAWIVVALLAAWPVAGTAGAPPLDGHYQSACDALQKGKRAKADVELKLALQNNPLHAKSNFLLACLLGERGEIDQSIVGFQRALTLQPDDPDTLYNLGTMLLRRGEPVPASRLLEQSVSIRPRVQGYNNLAKAYFLSGFPEMAVAAYKEALRLDPANATALKNLTDLNETAGAEVVVAQQPEMPPAQTDATPPAVATQPKTASTPPPPAQKAATIDAGDSGRMLEVDAIIFYVLKLDSRNEGFDFLRLIHTSFNYFAGGHQGGNGGIGFITPSTIGFVSDLPQQAWNFSASVNYDVNIANASDDEVALLSRPHLTTLSGTPAKFLAGGELVYRVAGNISGDIKPYPFGTTLTVTPTLLRTPGEDGAPRIHLAVEAGRTSLLSVLSSNSPEETTSFSKISASSEAVLSLGQTLIMSGLNQRETTTSNSGVPGLRSVPIIKYLFSTKAISDSQLSVIILLTPRDPAFIDEQWRKEVGEFIEMRRAYVQAMQGTKEDLLQFKERYPNWNQIPPNYFASHNFLMNNSDLYRRFNGQDLSSEDLEFGLLGPKPKKNKLF